MLGFVGAIVSIVIESASDEALIFPAVSLIEAVILQTPSAKSDAKVHVPEEIVQITLEDPFVAVTVAVPVKDPETFMVGLLFLVMLSLLELPESDASARSGAAGASMIDLLITTPVKEVLAADVTPLSVCCAESEYVPFESDVNVQEPLEPVEVKEQVEVPPPLRVAVNVTAAFAARDERENVGVSSEVLLSVLLVPRSEAASRSGVPGAANGVTDTVDDGLEMDPPPVLYKALIVIE